MARSSRGSFIVLSLGNLAGKALAFVREIVFAGAFGTGSTAAGFRIAQSLSFVPANLISSDVLSGAFVPAYARALAESPARAAELARTYFFSVTCLLGIATVVFSLLSTQIVTLVVPAASSTTIASASLFLSILAWSVPIYGASAVLALILATHARVLAQSTRPTIQSVGLLTGTLLTLWTGWMPWLAIGFLAAWLIYLCVLLGICLTSGYLSSHESTSWVAVRELIFADWRRISPLLPLPIAIQVSILLERTFASFGPEGTLAAVDYARMLSDSVLSLVAVPLGLLGLTRLSAMRGAQFQQGVNRGSGGALLVIPPLAAVMFIMAPEIVSFVFERGAFDATDVHITASVLQGQCLFLTCQTIAYFYARALMAAEKNGVVMLATFAAVAAQIATQSMVLTPLGALAIGLGPSAYGLVLMLTLGVALGLKRRTVSDLAILSPLLAVVVSVSVFGTAELNTIWVAFTALAIWVVQIWLTPRLRCVWVSEFLGPIQKRFGNRS